MNTIEQAHELLTEAREARTGSDAETSRHMSALVLATLAVAEQQKLGNEIAFLQLALNQIQTGNGSVVDEKGLQSFADRVVNGLGL